MKASSPPRSLLPPGHPHPSRTAGMPLVPAQIFRETQAGTPRRDFGRAGTGGAERVRARAGDPHCNIPESMNTHPPLGLLDLWDLLCSGKAPLPSHSLESALPQLGRGDDTGAIPKAFSQNEPRPGARHGLGWARSPWDGHRTLGWARMPWDGHVSHRDGHRMATGWPHIPDGIRSLRTHRDGPAGSRHRCGPRASGSPGDPELFPTNSLAWVILDKSGIRGPSAGGGARVPRG